MVQFRHLPSLGGMHRTNAGIIGDTGKFLIRAEFLNLTFERELGCFTTSSFSPSAIQTAKDLGTRIVLIDGQQLARLMIRYNIGCRDEDILHLKKVDEEFFE